MSAVRGGDISGEREYKGCVIYWGNKVCKAVSSISTWEGDWNLVLKFDIEAEETGIHYAGCAEMYQEVTSIRSETKMLSNTIVDLYARQI